MQWECLRPNVTPMWSNVAPVLPQCCPNVVPMWSNVVQCGPNVAPMWHQCCPNVAPLRPQCGPLLPPRGGSVHFVGRPQKRIQTKCKNTKNGIINAVGMFAPQCDPNVVQCCHSVAPMLPKRCPNVAPMLPQCCPNVAPTWSNVSPMWPQCVSHVTPMWHQCCPNVAPMGPQCGPLLPPRGGSIHFVGRPQMKIQKWNKNTKNWNHQCSGNVCVPM